MEGKKSFISRIAAWGPFKPIAESIRNKLLITILILSLGPLLLLGFYSYNVASEALMTQAKEKIQAMRLTIGAEVARWFEARRNDTKTLATSPAMAEAAQEFEAAFMQLGGGNRDLARQRAQKLYNNQMDLNDAGDGSAYSQVHAKYHEYLKGFIKAYGFNDLHIVSMGGDTIYTTTKESDFAVNTHTLDQANPLRQVVLKSFIEIHSDFGWAVKENENMDIRSRRGLLRTLEHINTDFTLYQDFSGVLAVLERPASYMVSPIIAQHGTGRIAGLLVLEMPIKELNTILYKEQGMGDTGEIYLVGRDTLFRSASRFFSDVGIDTTLNLDFQVNTVATTAALMGEAGLEVIENFNHQMVLSSWGYLDVQPPTASNPDGVTWAIMSEISMAEVQQPVVKIAKVVGGLVLGSVIVVILVALLLSGSLIRQVNAITALFSEIGMGEYDARSKVISQDELGIMATSLNAMLDNTLTLIQSREERDTIQASIQKLLSEVSEVAEGDLTIEAEVTDDIAGTIADSFNFMIHQLRQIIGKVQETTTQVSTTANEVQSTAETLAEGSESQATQITDTSAAIDEMAVSIQQVAENAALSATVGEQARANAQQGTEAVQNTIMGMERIRDQVQETAKRIKRLGESSQEIGDIIQLIGDIADRTSILALNASIQAAMAGEAGRGFAVVAEEVERLAERSTKATKDISTLVKTIQSETNEAVASMEAATNEVVDGSKLADQAGQALTEIETVSTRLAELNQSISQASKQQARGSEALAGSMNQIAEVTQQTASGTMRAAVSISQLAGLADELSGSVSAFKLPTSDIGSVDQATSYIEGGDPATGDEGSVELSAGDEGSVELSAGDEGSAELSAGDEGSAELSAGDEGSVELSAGDDASAELPTDDDGSVD